jgi:hypothetical protein
MIWLACERRLQVNHFWPVNVGEVLALAGAVLTLLVAGLSLSGTRGEVPSLTVNHRDQLPTYLRKLQAYNKRVGMIALFAALAQAAAYLWRQG